MTRANRAIRPSAALRHLTGASALALAMFAAPAASLAESSFPAPVEFSGRIAASSATRGAPILPGSRVELSGRGLTPGQELTVSRGTTVLNPEGPVTVDAEGNAKVGFDLPADAALGVHPVVVVGTNPSSTVIVDLKVSPDVALSGEEKVDQLAVAAPVGVYQSAYSAKNDALFTTSAVARMGTRESALTKLNPLTLEVVAQVTPAPAPEGEGIMAVFGLGLDDANDTVWVTNTLQNTVAVYKQSDLSLVKQFPLEAVYHARDVVVDAVRSKAYVSASASDTIAVFDTATLEPLGKIEIRSGKRGGDFSVMSLDLDSASGQLFTVSRESDELAVIDTATDTVAKVVALPGAKNASGVSFDAASGTVYVASQASDNLLIVDLASGEVRYDVKVGAGPLNVAFDPVSKLAFVSNRGAGTLSVVSPDGEIVATLDNGSYPNHVEVDGKGAIFAVNKSFGEGDAKGDRITRITLK